MAPPDAGPALGVAVAGGGRGEGGAAGQDGEGAAARVERARRAVDQQVGLGQQGGHPGVAHLRHRDAGERRPVHGLDPEGRQPPPDHVADGARRRRRRRSRRPPEGHVPARSAACRASWALSTLPTSLRGSSPTGSNRTGTL